MNKPRFRRYSLSLKKYLLAPCFWPFLPFKKSSAESLTAGRGWLLSPFSHAKDQSDLMRVAGHAAARSKLDRAWFTHYDCAAASMKPALIKSARIAFKQLLGTASQKRFFALVSAT